MIFECGRCTMQGEPRVAVDGMPYAANVVISLVQSRIVAGIDQFGQATDSGYPAPDNGNSFGHVVRRPRC